MKSVLISKRPLEMVALLVCLSLSLLVVRLHCAHLDGAPVAPGNANIDTNQQLPGTAQIAVDASRRLDGQLLSSLVNESGQHIQGTMKNEIDKLIDGVNRVAPSHPKVGQDDGMSAKLRDANKIVNQEIGTRIKLASDSSGVLARSGSSPMVSSFLSVTSDRLQNVGSFVDNKMRSLVGQMVNKIPTKLRKFFRWPTFDKFKRKFNKSYKSLREELYRQMIYLRSQVIVEVQQVKFLLRFDKHLLGATQYSDWTGHEYHAALHNRLAEVDDEGVSQLDAAARARLEALAKRGANIFGATIPAGSARPVAEESGANRKRFVACPSCERTGRGPGDQGGAERRRTKREAMAVAGTSGEWSPNGEDDYDGDELNYTEGEAYADGLGGEDDDDDEETLRVLESYSNVNMNDLRDANQIVDEVLASSDHFDPIDLRTTKCVSTPSNQHVCGNCYAFVTNTAARYYNCMQNNGKLDYPYHPRFTSDCGVYLTPEENTLPALNGCKGGKLSRAINYTRIVGTQDHSKYQIARMGLKFTDDRCAYPRPKSLTEHNWATIEVPYFKQASFKYLKFSEIDLHLRTVGPVFVNMRTWKNFLLYDEGIYDGLEEDPIVNIHSMLIVGHKKDIQGRSYWIIWNSHGVCWGDRGFLLIYDRSLAYFSVFFAGMIPNTEEQESNSLD